MFRSWERETEKKKMIAFSSGLSILFYSACLKLELLIQRYGHSFESIQDNQAVL